VERVAMSTHNLLKDARRGNVFEVTRRLAQGEDVNQVDEAGDTAIVNAAAHGHHDVVRVLLAHNASPEAHREDRPSALLRATQKGCVETVTLLADHHANLETTFPDGKTALLYACFHGLALICNVLLDHHANTEVADDLGNTALHYATLNGNVKIVNMLLDAQAQTNVYNYERNTPLLIAATVGHLEPLKALIEHGAEIDSPNDDAWTPLLCACEAGHVECAKVLLAHNALASAITSNGSTALILATKKGNSDIVRVLLNHPDTPIEARLNSGGMTALMLAASSGNLTILQLLLDANADFKATNLDNKTPLQLAIEKNHSSSKALLLLRQHHPLLYFAKSGHLGQLEQLVKRGVPLDDRDENGRTALMFAAAEGDPNIVNFLLQNNAPLEAIDNNGANALSIASGECRRILEREVLCRIVRDGDIQTFMEILAENATMDIEQEDENGKTLLMLAAENGHPDLVKLLLDRNADLDAAQSEGKTALSYALEGNHRSAVLYINKERAFRERYPLLYHARSGNLTAARACLKETPDKIDERDEDGWSALMYAASLGHDQIIQHLLENNAQIGGTDKGGKTAFMVSKDKATFVKLILEKNAADLRFNEIMFRGAIECDPKLGREILNAFIIEEGRYRLDFRDLDRIYGKESVEKSALYSILNLESDDDAQSAVKAHCLQHIVIRRVLQLKWEFFAQRMYIEQCLMYLLLLASSVISGCFYQLDEDPNNTNIFSLAFWHRTSSHTAVTNSSVPDRVDDEGIKISFMIWIVFVIYVLVSYVIAHYGLKPKRLWGLARWCRDGTYAGFFSFLFHGTYADMDWSDDTLMPDAPKWKSYAKRVLFFNSVFWTTAICLPFMFYLGSRSNAEMTKAKDQYQALNNIVLWFTAFYFFYWEYKELQGYGIRKYMSSSVNAVQIIIFALILFVYVPCQLDFIPETIVVREYQLCMAGTICLALWILALQYLEVHGTAGYLLPMMHGLLLDTVRFSILYGVFQVGLTCAYYILLQGSDGYETMLNSFVTVYFVLFGQIQTDPISALLDPPHTKPVLYVFAMGLLMFHMAVAIVLLLNVLIAMMNNTLVDGLEKAKLEALASYAKCVLRLELSLGAKERIEMIYVIKPKFLHHHKGKLFRFISCNIFSEEQEEKDRSVQGHWGTSEEKKPLLVKMPNLFGALRRTDSQSKHGVGILNPAFREIVLKSDYKTGYEQKGTADEEYQNEMRSMVQALKKDHTVQLQLMKSQLNEMTRILMELQATGASDSQTSSLQD
ncbi:inversin protein alternative isoform, partial [Thraustotheca clavata]